MTLIAYLGRAALTGGPTVSAKKVSVWLKRLPLRQTVSLGIIDPVAFLGQDEPFSAS